MGRLIDADALYEKLQSDSTYDLGCMDSELREIIERQPTAYDVEKVVERLEEESYTEVADDMNPFGDIPVKVVSLKDAIEIVKKGGVE